MCDMSIKFKCIYHVINIFGTMYELFYILGPMVSYGKIQKHAFVIDVFDVAVIMAITML